MSTPQWALDKIAEVKNKHTKKLDLSIPWKCKNEKLSAIPEDVFELEQLESLVISDNLIASIPKGIANLKYLKALDVSANGLQDIPEQVGKLTSLASLNLRNNKLAHVPDWIARMSGLKSLDIGNNEMDCIPHWISRMSNLERLGLAEFGLQTIPEWIVKLRNLTWLDLSANELTFLPEWLFKICSLHSLNLYGNQLTNLPDSIRQLSNLTRLNLWVNQLYRIPDTIVELKKLKNLTLGGNQLSSIPNEISKLQNLLYLHLGNNKFSSIPECIYELSSLQELSFFNSDSWTCTDNKTGTFSNHNSITEISPRILELTNLKTLHINNDQISIPPSEVLAKGLGAIKDYFRQIEDEGVDHLYEAKLLILGEGGAGKTSLAKKIENPDYQLQADEVSTQGIDVIRWSFPMKNGENFKVSIWDFGGQEIYHATHQFFLTKRSLYALVADTRKEDIDFSYWLNVVELLSGNSPLLIIKNEKQDRHCNINERSLRRQFVNIKEVISTDFATNRGLSQIVEEIKHHISKLEHIGSPLPKTWVKVREILENDIRNYISLDLYLDVCEKNGFKTQKDKYQLSSYLHDLGVCLHFQEDSVLKKTVILKPKWGTDAVYMVLDNPKVISNLGRFERADLTQIWEAPEYASMHDELLRLMMNFKLCYKIPSSRDTYIAPQLLTENQPDYDWDETNNLILRYAYHDFMPKGIITQFIVIMHELIADLCCVWKSGAVLEKDQTKAEVIEYYGKREVSIRVQGKHKKELLTIVTYELDKIHSSYKSLKYSKMIPCNCDRCKDSQQPNSYSYDTLRRYIADKKEEIECQIGYGKVNVLGLIDDVFEQKQPVNIEERDMRFGITFHGQVDQVVIQQTSKGDNLLAKDSRDLVKIKSAWANGSFYVFVFLAVTAALGILAKSVPSYAFPSILVAGVIFVPIIGAFQLKQDERLSEKSFIALMKIVFHQLPLLGKIAKKINMKD